MEFFDSRIKFLQEEKKLHGSEKKFENTILIIRGGGGD